MYNFISSEWYKLVRSRFFYVCALINAAVSALMIVSIKVSGESYGTLVQHAGQTGSTNAVKGLVQMVEFSEKGNPVWAAAYGLNNTGMIVGAIFIILFMNMEYKKGTMLMLIGRGLSKSKLVMAKMIVAMLGVEIIFLTSAVVSGITGLFIWGIPEGTVKMVPNMVTSIGCNMILLAGCLSVAVVIAVWVKNSGEAIGIYVVGYFVLSNALSIGMENSLIPKKGMFLLSLDEKIAQMSNIMSMPSVPWNSLGLSLVYLFLTVVICCWTIQRQDLV